MPGTNSQILKKILLWFFPLIILGYLITAILQYVRAEESELNGAVKKVKAIASTAAAQIDGEKFEQIRQTSDADSDNYRSISQNLKAVCAANKLPIDAAKTLRRNGNVTNFVVTSDNRNLINQEFNLWGEMNPTFNQGEVEIRLPYQKMGHTVISAFAPIKDTKAQIVGLLQIDMTIDEIMPAVIDFFLVPVAVSLLICLIGFFIIRYVLEPLQESIDALSVYFINLAEGELTVKYVEPDKGYLHEISTLLDKVQAGFRQKSMSDEDKEKLQKQTKELLRIVSAAADGDFTVNAQVTADTLGALADSFNLMISDLSELIRDVKRSADHVIKSTQGILEKTTEMTLGAENQAKEIDHIGNLAREMAEIAGNTNNSAQMASESAIHASEVAERGGKIVEQSIEGMQRIRETVTETSVRVRVLGQNSTRISEITEFISDIASRTNLLALNASIEAARAGNSGRGFTIIADEIRNLAERSSRSAGEITKLIDDIQTGMSETVMAMELGNNEVAEGTKKVDAAGAALREIQGAVEISTTSVAEITKATQKQRDASEDIVKVMEGIARIAQQTAEGAKLVESEINRLESLSKSLNDAVSKFNLSQ